MGGRGCVNWEGGISFGRAGPCSRVRAADSGAARLGERCQVTRPTPSGLAAAPALQKPARAAVGKAAWRGRAGQRPAGRLQAGEERLSITPERATHRLRPCAHDKWLRQRARATVRRTISRRTRQHPPPSPSPPRSRERLPRAGGSRPGARSLPGIDTRNRADSRAGRSRACW